MSARAQEGKGGDGLSVIIPTLKPLSELSSLLSSLDAALSAGDEVVVVQAVDSSRDPVELQGRGHHRTRVLFSPRGRGRQFNCGVAASRGSLLFFLHSDSQLEGDFSGSIRRVCADPRVSMGCFRLAFKPSSRTLHWIAAWANLRTRLLGMPYGDQGLFCRREIWERAGGFRKAYLMEDVDFVRQCRKLGRIHLLEERIHTSPRRYMEYGVMRASLLNHMTLCRYYLGTDDRALYFRYYEKETLPR